MKLRGYFYILAALMLFIFGITFHETLSSFSWNAVAVEVLIVVTIGYLLFFYGKAVRPLQNIGNGMDLLREQDFSSRLREVGQFEADRVVEIFNKMMEQLKNERLRLREQNEFLDLLIKASPMGVIVLDYDHRITEFNPAALKMMGMRQPEEVEGRKIPELNDRVRIDLTSIPLHETRTVTLHDGTIYKCTLESFIDRGFPRRFYLIESLTEEVRMAEKKAYEKVIRMIAHEVNNTSAGITSTLDTVGKELGEIAGMQDLQQAMQVCVERCYSMSRFITNFADVVKIPEADPVPTDLNGLIRSMTRFMEVMCLHRNIKLTFHPDENLPQLNIDASLFEQLLLNVIKNSVESIDKDGEIIITTDAVSQTLEVADNGKGISKDVENKIFNPFFSTKPAGQGIGLLFIREVLSQHQFSYSLKTYSDGWTRFVIRFDS